MTRKHPFQKGAKEYRERYVKLPEYLLGCAAWQALDGNSRSLYVEIVRRYRGPDSNNGKIPYSTREARDALHIGKSTAQRCFERLQEHGFLRVAKRSGFNMKGRAATEWLVTEFPDDTKAGQIAMKDFMRWEPAEQNNGPATGPVSPTTGPYVVLTRDAAA